jgi:SnoaL-like domain
MNAERIAAAYLGALEKGDVTAILDLFCSGAIVHSPLYGPLPAVEFYPRLFADTGHAKVHLRGVTKGSELVAIWFTFDWTLSSGEPADFECVDVLELDDRDRIRALRIFYDTATNRRAFESETGSSWRPS